MADPEYCNLPFIPSLEGSPWYCGKMERTQAEQYLMEVSVGCASPCI